jgi:hypothetical protein
MEKENFCPDVQVSIVKHFAGNVLMGLWRTVNWTGMSLGKKAQICSLDKCACGKDVLYKTGNSFLAACLCEQTEMQQESHPLAINSLLVH